MSDRWHAALVLGVILGLLAGFALGRSSRAASPQAFEPEPSWQPVPSLAGTPLDPGVAQNLAESTGLPEVADSRPVPGANGGVPVPSHEPAAASEQPTPTVGASEPVLAPTPAVAGPVGVGAAITGEASWFCKPPTSACTRGYPASGLYAAAGPALRVGAWRGRYVTAMANGHSVRLRLIDFCACGSGRIVDLYASVVRALGLPLSRGVYTVRVSW